MRSHLLSGMAMLCRRRGAVPGARVRGGRAVLGASRDPARSSARSQCLTEAIYYEARSESEDGQRAVAQVVLNRVRHPSYPNSVCGVVYQGSQRTHRLPVHLHLRRLDEPRLCRARRLGARAADRRGGAARQRLSPGRPRPQLSHHRDQPLLGAEPGPADRRRRAHLLPPPGQRHGPRRSARRRPSRRARAAAARRATPRPAPSGGRPRARATAPRGRAIEMPGPSQIPVDRAPGRLPHRRPRRRPPRATAAQRERRPARTARRSAAARASRSRAASASSRRLVTL